MHVNFRDHLTTSLRFLRSFDWSDFTRFRSWPWQKLRPSRALRVAIGVFLPLVIGTATGNSVFGAFAALGALSAAFASFQGNNRRRMTAVLASSLGMAVATFVGAIAAADGPWALVPIVGLLGLLVGVMVSLGPRLSVAAVQWPVALVIADASPMGPRNAAIRAGLVLAGGALQAILVMGSWFVRPGRAEARAVGDLYRELADYARIVQAGNHIPPRPHTFPREDILTDPNPLLPESAWRQLIELDGTADMIRASLAALTGSETTPQPTSELEELLGSAADALDSISSVLGSRADPARAAEMVARASSLSVPSDRSWSWAGDLLFAQLVRAACAVDLLAASTGFSIRRRSGGKPPTGSEVAPIASTIWANLTASTEAGRHAIRLSMTAMIAESIALASHATEGHWVVLTVFMVLKPDYGSTLSRGTQRALGTMLGAGLGLGVVELGHLSNSAEAIVATGCIAMAYGFFEVNYALYSVGLTAFVVVLLAYLGLPASSTAPARVLDTLEGAALGFAAFIVWPTWEAPTVRQKLADAVKAHAQYAAALLRQLASSTPDQQILLLKEHDARSARAAANAAVGRLRQQPDRPGLTISQADAVVAGLAELAHAELTMHTLVRHHARKSSPPLGTISSLPQLADSVEARLILLAMVLANDRRDVSERKPHELAGIDGQPTVAVSMLETALESLTAAILTHHPRIEPTSAQVTSEPPASGPLLR